MADHDDTIAALLDAFPQSHAEEIGADPSSGRPSDLFQLVVAAILYSARISSDIARDAAHALIDDGLTTAEKMADSSWQHRVSLLNDAGYTRYQEQTATMLGDASDLLLDRWKGDLRQLREEAERDPARERSLLKEIKGLGDTGVDIIFRDLQAAWDELHPFLDDVAASLGLTPDAEELAGQVSRRDLPRLVSALVRVELGDAGEVLPGDLGLRQRSKEELYERAKQQDIEGRSDMDKDQLVKALAKDR